MSNDNFCRSLVGSLHPFNSEMAVILLFHWNIEAHNQFSQWHNGVTLEFRSSGCRFDSHLSKLTFFTIFNHGRAVFLAIAELFVFAQPQELLVHTAVARI